MWLLLACTGEGWPPEDGTIGTTGLDTGSPSDTGVEVLPDDVLPASTCPVFVAEDGSSAGSGTEGDPLAAIQEGVRRVHPDCARVTVLEGTYAESVVLGARDIELTGLEATIDGGSGTALTVDDGQTSATVVSGFTLTGGSGSAGQGWLDEYDHVGGGFVVHRASPVLRDLLVKANTAEIGGGGVLYESNGTVQDTVFRNNTSNGSASYGGGALYVYQGAPTISDCTFDANRHTASSGAGGGVLLRRSDATIQDSVFYENRAEGTGGAIRSSDGDPTLVRNRFRGNDPDAITVSYTDAGLVANNTVLSSERHGLRVHCPEDSCEDGGPTTAFHNNLVEGSVYYGAKFTGEHAVTWSHNLFWDSGTGTYDGYEPDGALRADPELDEWTPGAAAIDAGLDVGLAYEGAAPDIGAVEVR